MDWIFQGASSFMEGMFVGANSFRAERNVFRCGDGASGEEQRSGERRKTH